MTLNTSQVNLWIAYRTYEPQVGKASARVRNPESQATGLIPAPCTCAHPADRSYDCELSTSYYYDFIYAFEYKYCWFLCKHERLETHSYGCGNLGRLTIFCVLITTSKIRKSTIPLGFDSNLCWVTIFNSDRNHLQVTPAAANTTNNPPNCYGGEQESSAKMRPILMKGHERPLTFLKYNRDGDLLFSCAKDHTPTVWYADNGERLGTYRGHNGAVWCCDVSRDSSRLITGSADQTAMLWDVQTGTQLYTFSFDSPARSVDFSVGDKLAVITTDPFMGLTSAIHVKRISRDPNDRKLLVNFDASLKFIIQFGQHLRNRLTESEIAEGPVPAPVSCRDGFGGKTVESEQHRPKPMYVQKPKISFILCDKYAIGMVEQNHVHSPCIPIFHVWSSSTTGLLVSWKLFVGFGALCMRYLINLLLIILEIGDSVLTLKGPQGRINRAVWGPLNKTIISAGEDAVIRIWDAETGKILKESDMEIGHKKGITSLQKSVDGSHFITGSLDKSAKLWDIRTLTLIKNYTTERPVNAVTMSPLLNHVVLGGGQDASAVTTTDHRAGKFEAKFYDKILTEEIGGVKGHFGPINALAFNPDGKSFASGGEDGYVRLHHFDHDYFNIKI
ncbi:Eukaryotic translation initiation factor 3 subunit I [Capsicum annuum]|nr:Eukaryotic translation initiation factor 3 subunit I [Capsicum annuum]